MKPETIQFIKNQAEYVRGILGGMEYNGKLLNSYVKLQYDLPEYSLQGEADHIGQINWAIIKLIHPEAIPEEKTINDLKYTGDIQRVWWEKQNFAGGKNKGRCWFLQHCQEGRAFMAGYKIMDFLKLNYEAEN